MSNYNEILARIIAADDGGGGGDVSALTSRVSALEENAYQKN